MPRARSITDPSANLDRAAKGGERFPRVTFTVPPDVAELLGVAWRNHRNLDGSLCQNKSNYIADLVRRDAHRSKTRRSD